MAPDKGKKTSKAPGKGKKTTMQTSTIKVVKKSITVEKRVTSTNQSSSATGGAPRSNISDAVKLKITNKVKERVISELRKTETDRMSRVKTSLDLDQSNVGFLGELMIRVYEKGPLSTLLGGTMVFSFHATQCKVTALTLKYVKSSERLDIAITSSLK